MEKVIFYILAVIMLWSAISAVSSRKMLRSVVYLLFVLIGASGLYFMMDYNFLAAVQLTVYAGGIVVLIIFSVLLIHHIEMELDEAREPRKWLSALLCLMGLSVFLATILGHDFMITESAAPSTVAEIGHALLSFEKEGYILPFEMISVLLLSAMIGAIVIARGQKETKKEPELDLESLLSEEKKKAEEKVLESEAL